MAMVIKETTVITTESIPIYPVSKRNSKSLDLSIHTDTTNSIRQHTRSTSDGGSIHTIDQAEPISDIQSSNRSRRGSHFSAFSSFTRTSKSSTSGSTNPFKNLVSRSSGTSPAASRYSISVSAPMNNPEAAVAMHPLNQIDCESNISPGTTIRKPVLPVGLQQEINRFAIDGFAHKYFSTHKRGLFRRRVPMNEMLKWTRDSIKQPLIMLNKDLYKDALRCFKMIQMVMGDRQRPRHWNEIDDLQTILTCGITKGQMRDEIYVQICKQLHDNPSGVTFPPSKNLEAYLTDFVQQNHRVSENHVDIMSQHVSTKLKRVCIRGSKGKVLTSAEIYRAKEAPFKPSVFGESLPFIMQLQHTLDPNLQIPKIVPFLAETVRETNGQLSEGIFRVPGDADAVTDLRVRIENGNYDATGITDPNVPASLLKYWLRDLADPIITCENYDDCIRYAEDAEKAIAIINGLPDTNRRIALFTISFLQEFTDPSIIKHTLMNVNNLAMVFAPNFLRCPSESLTTVFENSKYEQAFLRTLINEMIVDSQQCIYDLDSTKVAGILKT
ncbi:Rho GTPase activation protein [Thamnidium elegans]|nr:Rho GTPase activation protein [Thamnidium elegans]